MVLCKFAVLRGSYEKKKKVFIKTPCRERTPNKICLNFVKDDMKSFEVSCGNGQDKDQWIFFHTHNMTQMMSYWKPRKAIKT